MTWVLLLYLSFGNQEAPPQVIDVASHQECSRRITEEKQRNPRAAGFCLTGDQYARRR